MVGVGVGIHHALAPLTELKKKDPEEMHRAAPPMTLIASSVVSMSLQQESSTEIHTMVQDVINVIT